MRKELSDDSAEKEPERVPGILVPRQQAGCSQNYSYFPILVGADFPLNRDALYQKFCDSGINVRRYFYPLISNLSMYHGLPSAATSNLPVAKSISERVLCLPIYPDLARDDQDRVIEAMTGK
jgi:dTDP-4-amino-4,6-dideoxygalactose transaminase